MTNLVKRLLVPLVFMGALLFSEPVLAKDNKPSTNFYLSAGAGVFNGFEQPIKDAFGIIPQFRVGFGLEKNTNQEPQGASIRAETNFSYGTKKIQSFPSSINGNFGDRINIIDINSRILGIIKTPIINPYAGIQLSFAYVNEQLKTGSPTGFRFGGILGLDIPINKDFSFYIEGIENAPFLKNNYEGTNIDGLSLYAGIKFFSKAKYTKK